MYTVACLHAYHDGTSMVDNLEVTEAGLKDLAFEMVGSGATVTITKRSKGVSLLVEWPKSETRMSSLFICVKHT